jgi:hypothetical protein
MAAELRVLVAVPLIGRDAAQMAGWREAIGRVAEAAASGATFDLCAAVRASDDEAAQACADAGLRVLRVGDYTVGSGRRHNYAGVMLKRVRLVREAVETSAQVVWFVDADVRPAPADWAAAEALLRAGKPVVVVPYPVRWAGGAWYVCISDGGRLALCDARRLTAADGGDSVPILGGGMGCTAIVTAVAARIRFRVAAFSLPDGDGTIAGEDMGWFLNARAAGVEVRLPLGCGARHIGAPSGGASPLR